MRDCEYEDDCFLGCCEVSEVLTASIIREMQAGNTPDTWVNFYQTTRRSRPIQEHNHLHLPNHHFLNYCNKYYSSLSSHHFHVSSGLHNTDNINCNADIQLHELLCDSSYPVQKQITLASCILSTTHSN
jgi:hypothetical protein